MTRANAVLLLPLLAACAAGPGGVPALPSPDAGAAATYTAVSLDTTWFVTNRALRDGRFVRATADSLEFGFVVTRFRERAGPGSDGPYFEGMSAERVSQTSVSRDEFVSRLRARDSVATGSGTIMYVHGYAVSFNQGIRQAADIAHRGTHRGPMVAFVWPAHASIVSWPTPSAIVTAAYRDDSMMAVASFGAFREATTLLRNAVRPGALTVVGHSLGSRLVSEALSEPSGLRDSLIAHPLPALVLFAPDISIERFRDSLARTLQPIASRRIVYASDDDLLMGISRIVNHDNRAGQATPARTLVAFGVEVVDVTRGRRVNGAIHKMLEPGHGMRFASTALYDFFGVVRGLPSTCRAASGLADKSEDGAWRLSDSPLPSDPAPASCLAK